MAAGGQADNSQMMGQAHNYSADGEADGKNSKSKDATQTEAR